MLLPHTSFRKGAPCLLAVVKHSGRTRLFPSEKSPALCGVTSQPVTQETLVCASLSLQVLSSWHSQTVAFAASLLSHIKKKAGTVNGCLSLFRSLKKIPQIGWFRVNRNLLLKLGCGKSKLKAKADSISSEGPHPQRQYLVLCLTWWWRWKWISGTSCVRAWIPFLRVPLSWLPPGYLHHLWE